MKLNSIFLRLLGDFYQTIGTGHLLNGIDAVYSTVIWKKYNNIINKCFLTGSIKEATLKACFIDRDSYDYDQGFLIVDLFNKPVINAIGFANDEGEIEDVTSVDGFYSLSEKKKKQVIDLPSRFLLVNLLVSEDRPERVLNGLSEVDTDIEFDILELISFLNLHTSITKVDMINVTSILLGSHYIFESKETIVSIRENVVYTDRHIYALGEYPCSYTVGDELPFGTALSVLCKHSVAYNQTESLKTLVRSVALGNDIVFLDGLYKSVIKQTQIIEILSEIFHSTNTAALNVIAKLTSIYSSVAVYTIAPIVIEEEINVTESNQSINLSSQAVEIAESAFSEVMLLDAISLSLISEHSLIVTVSDNAGSVSSSSYIGGKISDKSIASIAETEAFVEEESSQIDASEQESISGFLTEVSLGGVEELGVMVNLFYDIIPMPEEKVDYLFYTRVIATGVEANSKVAQVVKSSLVEAAETPALVVQTSPLVSVAEYTRYNSEAKTSTSVLASEGSLFTIVDSPISTLSHEDKITVFASEEITPDENTILAGIDSHVQVASLLDNNGTMVTATESNVSSEEDDNLVIVQTEDLDTCS